MALWKHNREPEEQDEQSEEHDERDNTPDADHMVHEEGGTRKALCPCA